MGHLELSPDTVIAGEYCVERPLAQGGMGRVYVARQLSTGQQRALKVMHPGLIADPRLRERFEQEARVGGHIASEHVVQTIGAGVDPTLGLPWIAMELLRGEDLAAYADKRGAMPFADVLRIFRPLCHALAAAHAAGIVHRDVKPENVFIATAQSVDRSLDVKVLDFGIAKLVADARDLPTAHIGTPLWMAPEQSDPSAQLTPAADVWPLGLIAFQLLTGRCYWRVANLQGGSLQALLRESLVEPLIPASARAAELGVSVPLPLGFDAWFASTVARHPSERFQDAGQAMRALEALGQGTYPGGETTSPAVLSLPPAQASVAPKARAGRGVVLALGGLGVVVALFAVAAVALVAGIFVFREELAALFDSEPTPSITAPATPSPAATVHASGAAGPTATSSGESPSQAVATKGARKTTPVAPGPSPTVQAPAPPTASAAAAASPPGQSAEPAAGELPPFNRSLAESKVKSAAASAAAQCKAQKSPEATAETYTGSRGFRPDGTTTGGFMGVGGSRECAASIMRAVTYGKYGGQPDWHVEVVNFSITVQ